MARRLPISITTVFEMLTASEFERHPTLDSFLTRELSREHLAGLSKEAKKARRLAQTRLCRYRQKMAKAVARLDSSPANDATSRHPTRDIIDVRSPVLISA